MMALVAFEKVFLIKFDLLTITLFFKYHYHRLIEQIFEMNFLTYLVYSKSAQSQVL